MTKKRLSLVYLLVLLFTPFLIFSQKIDIQQLKGMKPRSLGPAGMSGRVVSIDVVLKNPNIIYAGTSAGGVWRSENGGTKWEPIFDDQPLQGIGAVTVNQGNPNEIWVGTGEGNPRNSHNTGGGIFKSIDGGKSWLNLGLEATQNIHRIIIHKDNPNIVYVGAMGSIWGTNPERGVYRTQDGGKTWKQILYINDTTGIADLVVDPTNHNKIIAATWQFGRKPWTFNSGGPGSGIHMSYDGGDTWTKLSAEDGLPKGNLGRIGLAIAPSAPNIVYALVEAKKNGLYKSEDGGHSWKLSADKNIGNRPFYYHDIFVDPKNENRLYNLFSLVDKSEDGGKTFQTLLPYSHVHPDHHAFWVHPEDPNFIIEGNDGGLYLTRDRGKTWQFAENIPVGHFYHVSYDMDIPYHIAGGMQDNGSWVGPAYNWKNGGIKNHDWQEVFFGDGFDVSFQPSNSRYVYAMSQGGNLGKVDRVTGKTNFIKPVHPNGERLRFNWNAAFAQNPFSDCGIYYGSQYVHRSTDCGQTWEIISPDLTTNDPEKQQQHKSGGLTIDNTQAENHTTILAITPSPHDEKVIWVGTDDGNLQLTKDGGQTWTNLADRLPGVKKGSWIPYIEVSSHQAGVAFIIVNDYRRNDFSPMVFKTNDQGKTFQSLIKEGQVDGFTKSIVQDPVVADLLWLGTDRGLYCTIDGGQNWNKWTNGFPSVQVADLKIHPREHDLIIGTFGRSLWILDDIRPIRSVAQTKGAVLKESFKFFEAPEAYLAEFRSYDGYHFPADALFVGENRQRGARFTFWLNPDLKLNPPKDTASKKTKQKLDKVKIEIFNADNQKVRTYQTKIDTGINRIAWNLRRDGVRFPSNNTPKPGSDLPSGLSVLPGNYKVVASIGAYKDSTNLVVHADPRLTISLDDLKKRETAVEEYYALVKLATQGYNTLKDAKKSIDRVDEALSTLPDSTKKAVLKLGKSLKDSIQSIQNKFSDPPNTKGIVRTPGLLNQTLRGTGRYLSASGGAPNQAAQFMLNQLKTELSETLELINTFMDKDFEEYKKQVESLNYSLFKPFETIKLE